MNIYVFPSNINLAHVHSGFNSDESFAFENFSSKNRFPAKVNIEHRGFYFDESFVFEKPSKHNFHLNIATHAQTDICLPATKQTS